MEKPAREALQSPVIRFPEPLDCVLLEEAIVISGPDGKPVAGKSEKSRQETAHHFTPLQQWQVGAHKIKIESLPRMSRAKSTSVRRDAHVMEFSAE